MEFKKKMTTQKRAAANKPFSGYINNGDSDIDNNIHNKQSFFSSLSPLLYIICFWLYQPVNIIYPADGNVNSNVFYAKSMLHAKRNCAP